MVMLKQAYSNLISSLQFSGEKSSKQQPIQPIDQAQKKAQKIIQTSPTSSRGYLDSAQIYRQKDQLRKALNIYRQGLQLVPQDDPYYDQLQKEKNEVSATLAQRSRGFHQLLPYDILATIFGKLDFRDLLRCTGVCTQWCDFMMDWPEFWQKLSREMPQMNRSTLDPLLRRQAQEFRLEGPLDMGLVHDMLKFLSYSDNHFMEALHFSKLSLTNTEADLLAGAIRSTSPPVKRIEFVDCKIPQYKIASPILEACSHMERVTFSQSTTSSSGYGLDPPKKNEMIIPTIEYSSLTYLKLSFAYDQYNRPYNFQVANGRLGGILHQCPNLAHLFMDSGGTIYHGYLIQQVLKQCHRLETLVVAERAAFPSILNDRIEMSEYDDPMMTAKNNDNINITTAGASPEAESSTSALSRTNNKNNNTTTNKPPGLRRLVLSGSKLYFKDSDMVSIYKRHYKTLEMIYLHYDGAAICTTSFYRLAYHGAPRLREIYLSTENSCSYQGYKHPPIGKALAALFTACPNIEIIDINDALNTTNPGYSSYSRASYLIVTNETLKEIAHNCPRLRKLRITGRRAYTKEGLIYFATHCGKRLVDLEMDIEWQHVLEVVNTMTSLQRLHVRNDSLNHSSTNYPNTHRETANNILGERGGGLTVG
ncbi:hypothetical protein BDA99DRAFT_610159 [Phascolomyces articulosus]|uniref:F-box domain-containing protein n=1 Tax=Phascolomyces articulosus TaxID=60185 RepID=A0AAD5P7A3_9FUNG|nr:hypothetical protein BDA99DRAFT_610159 [Phascolomyces articulosus]